MPDEVTAGNLLQRAKDLHSNGFEWTTLYGQPHNHPSRRYPFQPPCCGVNTVRSRALTCSTAGWLKSRQLALPRGTPTKAKLEWNGQFPDPGTYDGDKGVPGTPAELMNSPSAATAVADASAAMGRMLPATANVATVEVNSGATSAAVQPATTSAGVATAVADGSPSNGAVQQQPATADSTTPALADGGAVNGAMQPGTAGAAAAAIGSNAAVMPRSAGNVSTKGCENNWPKEQGQWWAEGREPPPAGAVTPP